MTGYREPIEKVLSHIRATRGWYVGDTGGTSCGIRRVVGGTVICCPITSFRGQPDDAWEDVAISHDIPWEIAASIVVAADGDETDARFDGQLRAALLEAAGLEDEL